MITTTAPADIITRLAVNSPHPMKIAALAAGTHWSEWTVRKVVRQLIDEGELVKTPEGRIAMATATKEKAAKADKTEKTEAASRGGPREHTVAFDAEVLKAIGTSKAGKSKGEIAEALGSTESLVYGAIHRLKTAGKVQKIMTEGSRTPTWARA